MFNVRCWTFVPIFVAALLLATVSCRQQPAPPPPPDPPPAGAIARVGSITIREADLTHILQEKYSGRTDPVTRRAALDELVRRARFAQAALDAGMADDPVVRQEMDRLLEARLREQQLAPKIKAIGPIPEARLRELFQADLARFQSPEKRQVAVLWLDPGRDPERAKKYVDKLTQARAWLLANADLVKRPDEGFSVLSVDYSEHQATRFKNGVLGWLQHASGSDKWRQAVAEIAFSIETVGEVSPVTTSPEGIFLIRLMDKKPALQVPFDSVAKQLEQEERSRLRQQLEAEFEQAVEARREVEWLVPQSGSPLGP